MAATNLASSITANRRRRVRHRIQTPAYASFVAVSEGTLLDLHEIVDISEEGASIQFHTLPQSDLPLNLCLDLADCPQPIFTTGTVVWTSESGRTGLRFTELPPESLARLREWLFVNVMAGVTNAPSDLKVSSAPNQASPLPNYTDTLAAITAVVRQVEGLGSDLPAALQLIAARAQSLLRASGAAIALLDSDPEFMVCRASSGPDAPPVNARLQVGSGFSGECVKRGSLLRCDDAESDTRVDRESCRALGIRSVLAAPVQVGDKSIGIVEALSSQPNAFTDIDGRVIRRLADLVIAAVDRSAMAENLPPISNTPADRFTPPQGGVLFAASEHEETFTHEEQSSPGLTLPRSYLIVLTCAAATIAMALGFLTAPWIQSEIAPWVQRKLHLHGTAQLQTVLASSNSAKPDSIPAIEMATLDQLRKMAESGDAAAQNALGLRYATGEGVALSEEDAVRWFTMAAEQGYVPAQSKLGSIYYSGRGVPQDPSRAYFWMVVARLSGDDASKTLAPFVSARLTRSQIASIEQDASHWIEQHNSGAKPIPGQAKFTRP